MGKFKTLIYKFMKYQNKFGIICLYAKSFIKNMNILQLILVIGVRKKNCRSILCNL